MAEESKKDSEQQAAAHEEEAVAAVADEPETDEPGETEEPEEPFFVEDPVFEIDYKGDCAYEVKVTVPPANERKHAEVMLDEIQQEAEVKGFRRGKAPRKVIEHRFSKAVKGEVAAKIVSAAFQKLLEVEELIPLALPEVDGLDNVEEHPADEPLEFTLKFDVAPRANVGSYDGIEVERPIVTVDDKDIDETIEEMRQRYSVFESVDKRSKAKEGDQVVIDFKGTIDGEEFQGGSAQDYPYILGTKRFFDEFEEVLEGAKTDETKTAQVTFPEDAPNENLRGKTAEFAIEVKEIKRRKLPEVNDDFAKQAGYDDLDGMKESIAGALRSNSEGSSDQVARDRALDAVVEASSYEIPKVLIEQVAKDIYQDEFRRLMSMRVPVAVIQEREDELRAAASENAVKEIKRIVTLNKIAEAADLEVTDADLDEQVAAMAAQLGVGEDYVADYLSQEDQSSSMASRILRKKALDLIMDKAVVTNVEVERDKLEQEAEESTSDSND
ncbi:MAG: trigger factor [Candidatus Hydrogenedentes bacterium]|nr:trigger factor [Candidatus Hydrogenedentota bacterium]